MIRPEYSEPKRIDVWRTIRQTIVGLLSLVVVGALILPAVQRPNRGQRSPCKNNLKLIGLALHNYHETYKSFPPAFVLGPDGKPWHSWRVLILPFLEEGPLWEKYRLDEPWNGPNNSKLLGARPEVFACRGFDGVANVPKHQTSYVAVVGSETTWPGEMAIGVNDITDGTFNTILVVEVREAGISWMAPDDLSLNEAIKPPNEETGRHPSSSHTLGGHVLMGDGAVRFVNTTLTPEIWKSLLTRSGGEKIEDF